MGRYSKVDLCNDRPMVWYTYAVIGLWHPLLMVGLCNGRPMYVWLRYYMVW